MSLREHLIIKHINRSISILIDYNLSIFIFLAQELAQSLYEMSRRLIQAISCWESYQESLPNRGTTDAILLDLLNVNDELHTVLMRYGRVVRPTKPNTVSI